MPAEILTTFPSRVAPVQQLLNGWGTPAGTPSSISDLLLVIADAAAHVADPGYQANFRNRRLISAWPRKHVADLANFTFRLLSCGEEVRAKGFAGRVLEGSDILPEQLLGIRIAKGDGHAVADIAAKDIKVAIQEAALSLVEHVKRLGLIRLNGG